MRRTDFDSDAAYYRAHREAFCLAQELGCTPAEAEREIARRAAAEKDRKACARLAAKVHGTTIEVARAGHDPEERRKPWWQRED